MRGRFGQNAPNQIETVLAAEMRHDRLMGIFRREGLDFGLRDIGRVGDDHVIGLTFNRIEKIAAQEVDPVDQIMVINVDSGDLQRIGRQFYRVDVGVGEGIGGKNCKASGTGTEIEHGADAFRVAD